MIRRPVTMRETGQYPPSLHFQLLEEPCLLFRDNYMHGDPKRGITEAGPSGYDTPNHPSEILVGVVGTGETQYHAAEWIKRCGTTIPGKLGKERQFPDFPGLSPDRAFRTKFEILESPLGRITSTDVSNITSNADYASGFRAAVDLLSGKAQLLCQSDSPPHIVLLSIPDAIADYCWSAGRALRVQDSAGTVKDRLLRKMLRMERVRGQKHFLSALFGEPSMETDFVGRNLRRALKARTMKWERPIQIGLESGLFSDSPQRQDPATKAWNFCVAMYYKAGALPWKLEALGADTCFVGVSFYRHLFEDSFEMHTSLAQVFTGEGDAFVLRGHKFPWPEPRRSPHLTRENAGNLINLVLTKYREFKGNLPRRVVVHKTSKYTDEEVAGFREGLRDIQEHDLLSLQHVGIRFFREGAYPPLRGTLCEIGGKNTLLYTMGYIPALGTYPRGYVPEPWQIMDHYGDTPVPKLCKEILALTKMNWNNADIADGEPITMRFARKVGEILSYIPHSETPHPSYRFYM